METTLLLIGSTWKVLILRELMHADLRFGQLKEAVGGISQKVLTAALRAMEEDGLVWRRAYAEVPPRVEYGLTDAGRSLDPVLESLRAWGEEYQRAARRSSAEESSDGWRLAAVDGAER